MATIEETIRAAGFDPIPSAETPGAGSVEIAEGWTVTYYQTGPGYLTLEIVDTSKDPFEVVREYVEVAKPRVRDTLARISAAVEAVDR